MPTFLTLTWQVLCNGKCSDRDSDTQNCGQCGNVVSLPIRWAFRALCILIMSNLAVRPWPDLRIRTMHGRMHQWPNVLRWQVYRHLYRLEQLRLVRHQVPDWPVLQRRQVRAYRTYLYLARGELQRAVQEHANRQGQLWSMRNQVCRRADLLWRPVRSHLRGFQQPLWRPVHRHADRQHELWCLWECVHRWRGLRRRRVLLVPRWPDLLQPQVHQYRYRL